MCICDKVFAIKCLRPEFVPFRYKPVLIFSAILHLISVIFSQENVICFSQFMTYISPGFILGNLSDIFIFLRISNIY